MKNIKFLSAQDGHELYEVCEVPDSKADQYLEAGHAVIVNPADPSTICLSEPVSNDVDAATTTT